MNKRIRDLVRQSHLDVYGLGKDKEKWESTVEEFTQLIVKECIRMVENEANQYSEPVWAFELVNDMQERFGV